MLLLTDTIIYYDSAYSVDLHVFSTLSQLRGHFQTIFGKINVIMTLGGRGVRALTFTLYTI